MDLSILLQTLINGVFMGGVYTLVAIGLTLVYGVMMIVNFAHADFPDAGFVCGLLVFCHGRNSALRGHVFHYCAVFYRWGCAAESPDQTGFIRPGNQPGIAYARVVQLHCGPGAIFLTGRTAQLDLAVLIRQHSDWGACV